LPELLIEDLFVVGLGVEVVGADLVDRGLLADPQSIARRVTTRGFHALEAVSQASDRVAASYGLACIGSGFVTQFVGYLLVFSSGGSRVDRPGPAVVTALVLGVLFALLAGLVYRRTYRRRTKRLLLEIAHSELYGDKLLKLPQADVLRWLGQAFGEPSQDRETDAEYGQRVFGVTEFDPASLRRQLKGSEPVGEPPGPPSNEFVVRALTDEMRRRGFTGGL